MAPMEFDPYSPALHADPYPIYRRLRDDFPLHRNHTLGFWTLSRWDDVHAALLDPATFCSGQGIAVGIPLQAAGGMPMLITMDAPRHTHMRSLVQRAFTPRRIAELEPRIRKIATALLDEWSAPGEVDLVRDYSAPLPTIVIAELLGVPASDQKWFKEKSVAISQFEPGLRDRDASADGGPVAALLGYLGGQLEERRAQPRDDLLSALLAAEIDGARLSEAELLGFSFLLLVAGNETTTNLISNASIQLDLHPDQLRLLVEEPERIDTAVEEFLRFDAPVQGLARTLTRDVTLYDTTLREGEQVLLLFASANRDERHIPDAERFDVTRHPNPHLSFGFGSHFCLGASLARLEARVAFEELLARHPRFAVDHQRVERLVSGPLRGALRVPLSV